MSPDYPGLKYKQILNITLMAVPSGFSNVLHYG